MSILTFFDIILTHITRAKEWHKKSKRDWNFGVHRGSTHGREAPWIGYGIGACMTWDKERTGDASHRADPGFILVAFL